MYRSINIRGPFIVGPALVAAVGYILLVTSIAVAVRYFAFFLSVQIFIGVTLVLMWVGNACGGLEERWSTGYIGDRQFGPVLRDETHRITARRYRFRTERIS